jgi:uncharacterized repeat protein (TIGR03843 family)
MTDNATGTPGEAAAGGGREGGGGRTGSGRKRAAGRSSKQGNSKPSSRAGSKGGTKGTGSNTGNGAGQAAGGGEIDEDAALLLLAQGELEIEGRLVVASNATLYCTVRLDGAEAACVYKPVAGERPLWDFPSGTLSGREVAAYAVSKAAGWNIVPPTVFRDGPFGPGMCQLWIDCDPDEDIIALARRDDHDGLRDMAVFDAVVNNADRKIGHLLPTSRGHLYGCDHGVTFAEEYKLRTVLWQWRGEPLPPRATEALRRLGSALEQEPLATELSSRLDEDEVTATRHRVELLLKRRVHPYPPDGWPAVPWPPV